MMYFWLSLKRPLLAQHFGIAADLVAIIPTYFKSWENPAEESKNVFIAGFFASILGIFAATNFKYENIIFPTYLLLSNASIVIVIFLAEKRHVT